MAGQGVRSGTPGAKRTIARQRAFTEDEACHRSTELLARILVFLRMDSREHTARARLVRRRRQNRRTAASYRASPPTSPSVPPRRCGRRSSGRWPRLCLSSRGRPGRTVLRAFCPATSRWVPRETPGNLSESRSAGASGRTCTSRHRRRPRCLRPAFLPRHSQPTTTWCGGKDPVVEGVFYDTTS